MFLAFGTSRERGIFDTGLFVQDSRLEANIKREYINEFRLFLKGAQRSKTKSAFQRKQIKQIPKSDPSIKFIGDQMTNYDELIGHYKIPEVGLTIHFHDIMVLKSGSQYTLMI